MMVKPAYQRDRALQRMMIEAHAAHKFHKRKGRPHPKWGNGSLLARANCESQIAEPFASDIAYLQALDTVIKGLLLRKDAPSDRHSPVAQKLRNALQPLF